MTTKATVKKADKLERIARQIALTSESIRKKNRALKTGQMEEEVTLEKRLKPLVEPLKKIAENTQSIGENSSSSMTLGNTLFKKERKAEESEYGDDDVNEFETPQPRKSVPKRFKIPSTTSELSLTSPRISSAPPEARGRSFFEDEETYEHTPIVSPMQLVLQQSPESREKLLNQYGKLGRKYVGNLLKSDKNVDIVYGVYYDDQGMMLGDKRFDLKSNDDIIIGDRTFRGTPGLYKLIFSKLPDKKKFTPLDSRQYAIILLLTNAHKRGRDSRLPIKSNRGYKYKQIIGPLLRAFEKRSGSGNIPQDMTVTDDAIEYVHWDDPNELVDRLRMIDASRRAGNNAHDNEFLAIIEELREAGIIIN